MTDDRDGEETQWRFGVDDVGDDSPEGDTENDTGTGTGEGVMGSTDSMAPDPEPGSPTAENTLFVLLGSLTMVAIIALLLL